MTDLIPVRRALLSASDKAGLPELAAALAMSLQSPDENPPNFGPVIPPDFTGYYELFAVVTHKGRSADSGHYMGWVRQQGDNWLVFDDDEVSECNTSHIMDLKGGGTLGGRGSPRVACLVKRWIDRLTLDCA